MILAGELPLQIVWFDDAVPPTLVALTVTGSVLAALLPQLLSAVTDKVPLVAPAAKSIVTLFVPFPFIVAPVPEYAHVYEVAPATPVIEYAFDVVLSQTVVEPLIAPGVPGTASTEVVFDAAVAPVHPFASS